MSYLRSNKSEGDRPKETVHRLEADGGIRADNIDHVVRAERKLSSRVPAFFGRPIMLRQFIECAKLSVSFRRLLFSRFRVLV
jgi:hypothetical protein